jgi:hypothetical protein
MMESVDDFIESEKQKTSKAKSADLRFIAIGKEVLEIALGRLKRS